MVQINISGTPEELGRAAAERIALEINRAIEKQGHARIALSTGASQFETLEALVKMDIDWKKVTMFHLDEYVALPESHKASFRKYLKERFVSKVDLAEAIFVDGEGDPERAIEYLSRRIAENPIDVGVIGIGENGHVAFNDPPADFETERPYIVVDLAPRCKQQQVGEGWFESVEAVPAQAISMSVRQIMSSRVIVSAVPHAAKAEAVQKTLLQSINCNVPATILKSHPCWYLFLDVESAGLAFSL